MAMLKHLNPLLANNILDVLPATTKRFSDSSNEQHNGNIVLPDSADNRLVISYGIAQEIGYQYLTRMSPEQLIAWGNFVASELFSYFSKCDSIKGKNPGLSYNSSKMVVNRRYFAKKYQSIPTVFAHRPDSIGIHWINQVVVILLDGTVQTKQRSIK